jgi:hypothetical protein
VSAAARAAALRVGLVQVVHGELGVVDDNGEQVVEVVGNPAREAADGLHALREPEAFLGLPLRRHVAEGNSEAIDIRAPGMHRQSPAQPLHAVLDPLWHAGPHHSAEGLDPAGFDAGDDLSDRPAQDMLDGKTGMS